MKRLPPVRFPLILLTVVAGLLPAQSFFNSQGLGEIGRAADARSAALGAHAALDWQNPGWLIHLPQTSFTVSLLGAGTVGAEATARRFIGTVRPAGFYAGVPLPLNARLTLGLDECFNQDFDIWTESLPDDPYRYRVISRGGIYALKAGLAWSFLGAGGIGAEYSRQLGAAREDWRLEASRGSYVSIDTIETDYAAHGFKFGAAADLGRVGLGAWFALPLDYRVETRRRVHGIIGDTLVRQQLRLPASAAFGLRWAATGRLELSAGAEYRPWSDITLDEKPGANWRDAWRLGGGTEFSLDTLRALRLGYSYQDYYYATGWAASESLRAIDEHRLHLGTNVPVPGFGSLDFALELARRDNGVLAEYAGRLMLSLAYREAWLRRTRRWGY